MNRRGFIGSILAAAVAPAIVRADSLMRIVPRDTLVAVPSADTLLRVRDALQDAWGLVRFYDINTDTFITKVITREQALRFGDGVSVELLRLRK